MQTQRLILPHLRVVDSTTTEPARLNTRQQEKRDALVVVMRYIRKLRGESGGESLGPAVAVFQRQHKEGALASAVITALATLQPKKAGKCPDRATLYRWDDKYRQHLNGDTAAAAPKHKGKERKVYGWEAVALRLWQTPTKRSISSVAIELREDHGFDSATDSRVRSYLKSLPANFSANSSARMGARLYRNTQRGFVRRDTECLPTGFIYQGDGHTIDVYIAHPFTGDIWRAELTVWLDVRSRYVAGWYISESESSHSTLFALSRALVGHDHVPAMLHIDNGSGYASKMMNDDSVGYYARFDIEPMFALPYNAKAKGQVERFFGTMERDFGKRWDTYCGADMADEALQKVVREVKTGKLRLPSLHDYSTALAAWIEKYHNRSHDGLNGRTPAELWSELEQVQLHTPSEAIIKPRVERSVGRQTVRLHNREYSAPELVAYNGDKLVVEYDLLDDSAVRILAQDGRWVCDAKLVRKAEYIPQSRMEEASQKRLKGQVKRLQQKQDELEARAGLAITHDQVIDDIEALNEGAEMLLDDKQDEGSLEMNLEPGVAAPGSSDSNDELNILDTNY